LDGTNELNVMANGKFEIGEDEADDENIPASPVSDWEDSDAEKNADFSSFWDDDEEELSQFICQLYESLFREGAGVNVALQHALATYRRVGYVCHLPGVQ
jgi:hypothetical protein